ncbi:EF-hand calcium-binding domain-containing protein 10 [Tritrichomonas musculus]|uniref:EF-hand calcium-binding domain-containing protein 10 n=1 Tax=Tritrichomonas musculus TaxID=1915356 RepID=A0ABR2H5W8_9EUKA
MTHNPDSARAYITQKHILQLMQALTTAIAYSKPEDPVSFITQVLTDLKEARDNNGPIFVCFTPENVKAMWSVLDPFEKGSITRPQLEGAMLNFGTDNELIPTIIGENNGPFNFDDFSNMIQQGIRQTLLTPA